MLDNSPTNLTYRLILSSPSHAIEFESGGAAFYLFARSSKTANAGPVTDPDYPDHFSAPSDSVSTSKNSPSKDVHVNIKKSKAQKCKEIKDNQVDFVFPKKTCRLNSPTKSPELVLTQNNFENLEQDVEPSLNSENNAENNNGNVNVALTPKPPPPVMLKINKNYREQLKIINDNFPEIASKNSGNYIRLFTNTLDERISVMNFLEKDKDFFFFEFYTIPPKEIKPIKVVIKGLPGCTKPSDVQLDLEELGYTVISCNQLISKVNKNPLPFFLIAFPKNDTNLPIFNLTRLGYMQITVEGYLITGITQCFRCNNFYHTAENCHIKPRCLKCGEEHLTKDCKIKE
ncbi:nucleic-acid-binding protein from transposon X-element [Trichonephila clavipes]|nr:nucleic-acid-binding protein from transposon X-element [Trichonephila clavipes]